MLIIKEPSEFQCLIGRVKTRLVNHYLNKMGMFQCLIGRVKTQSEPILQKNPNGFQCLIGRVKTCDFAKIPNEG